MLSMQILACIAVLLPSLVVCERTFLGGCGFNFDNHVDTLAHTEQGKQLVTAFLNGDSTVYLWNPNLKEETRVKNVRIESSMIKFTYMPEDGAESEESYPFTFTYEFEPRMEIKMSVTASEPLEGFLGINSEGEAELFPVYISDTDLILRACEGRFLGRAESLYVFSTQDYSVVDSTCSSQAVEDAFGWSVEPVPT